jgi:two-component system, sensor histidine kinase
LDRPSKWNGSGLLLAAQHQLRQPLNAIGLLAGELRQGPDARDLAAIADDLKYAQKLCNAWLDSLVELEQAQQGLLDLRVENQPLQPIFNVLHDDLAARFEELGLKFRVVPTRAAVRADPVQLRRILAVLLDNAAKFCGRGGVLLGCRRAGGRLRIEVRDTGPGIPEEAQLLVFEPFFRLENEVRPRERGLGLGLAYARQLAALAGERLTVASTPGRGTCFSLTLPPATGAAETPAPQAATNPLEGAEVILLEGAAAAELQENLESWGAAPRVIPVSGLAEALAAGAKLVIADCEAFAGSGGWDHPGNGVATLVLLADAPPQKTAPAAAAAATHYLQRPVKPARLRALCHYALTRQP